jgi:hypothetical protein
MAQYEQLRQVVEDLVEVMHLQTKQLEQLVERVEQVAGHLGFESRLSVIASELSEIHRRVQRLREDARTVDAT